MKKLKKQEQTESWGQWILQVLILVAIFFGIFFVLNKFVFANLTVSGISMQPTFENNDRVIASSIFVPSTAGLMLAYYIIEKVIND